MSSVNEFVVVVVGLTVSFLCSGLGLLLLRGYRYCACADIESNTVTVIIDRLYFIYCLTPFLSNLSAQLSLERGQHLAEEGGGFRGGGDCGIEIDERGQRTLRRNVVVSKDRLDAAGRAHARIRILDVDLLDQ